MATPTTIDKNPNFRNCEWCHVLGLQIQNKEVEWPVSLSKKVPKMQKVAQVRRIFIQNLALTKFPCTLLVTFGKLKNVSLFKKSSKFYPIKGLFGQSKIAPLFSKVPKGHIMSHCSSQPKTEPAHFLWPRAAIASCVVFSVGQHWADNRLFGRRFRLLSLLKIKCPN